VIKQAPSVGRIIVMVTFALSCFGILLFLWLSFGGPVPLQPKGYRFTVKFPEATQLAQEAEVRISGVKVGKVTKKEQNARAGLTSATIEMNARYAPVPRDTRAILRQKTLLGETYVELSPGDRSSGNLPDGGRLPQGQVAPTVELDEIFRSFDEPTRKAFQIWLEDQGRGVNNRGQSINEALANLTPFAENTDRVLSVLHRQEGATRRLVRDTGAVFQALSERQGQLSGLVTNSNRVFETTAARNNSLADAVMVLPTFLRESRRTVQRLTPFALNTNPLVSQLRPAARQLSPTLIDLADISPDLEALFRDLRPLIRVSRRGLPALEEVLGDARPLLEQFDPFLRQVIPISNYLGFFRREITAFFANVPASTQATDTPAGAGGPVHYLRLLQGLRPEDLAAYPRRPPSSRLNPYPQPGSLSQIRSGLSVFGRYLCKPPANSAFPLSPALIAQLNATDPTLAPNIIEFAFGGNPANVPTPACKAQTPLGRLVGQPGVFPRLLPSP
jgi:phospholipid/cholesterol/gamma-HCH transport system substrate-binding protein